MLQIHSTNLGFGFLLRRFSISKTTISKKVSIGLRSLQKHKNDFQYILTGGSIAERNDF